MIYGKGSIFELNFWTCCDTFLSKTFLIFRWILWVLGRHTYVIWKSIVHILRNIKIRRWIRLYLLWIHRHFQIKNIVFLNTYFLNKISWSRSTSFSILNHFKYRWSIHFHQIYSSFTYQLSICFSCFIFNHLRWFIRNSLFNILTTFKIVSHLMKLFESLFMLFTFLLLLFHYRNLIIIIF